jgi:protein-disulfide isomerase
VKLFPGRQVVVAAPSVAALPAVSDVERTRLAEWWEVQPKVDVKIDAGGAKVVVVKFNDYQCPPCRITYDAYKPIFQKHGNHVKYVLRHFPLEGECNGGTPGGSHYAACEAAAAVLMARAKGTAEKMEEWLFANQGPPQLTPAQVRAAARDVAGITDFEARYPEILKEVRTDVALGTELKVNSTPTFFINGRMLPQILAPQYFNALIELELKRP